MITWDVKAPADGKAGHLELCRHRKGGKLRGDALRIKQALQTPLPVRTLADANAEVKGRAITLKPDTQTTKGDLIVSLARTLRRRHQRHPRLFRTLSRLSALSSADDEDDGHQNEALWEIIANSLPNYLSASGSPITPRRQQRGLPGADRVCAVGRP